MTFVKRNIKKQSAPTDSHSTLDLVNRSLKLLGNRSLSEILVSLTFVEAWAVLVSLVMWSMADKGSSTAWNSKGMFLLSLLAMLCTGLLALYVWIQESSPSQKPSAQRDDWK
jgi:hypothetical protein